jgi:hypothetical protein
MRDAESLVNGIIVNWESGFPHMTISGLIRSWQFRVLPITEISANEAKHGRIGKGPETQMTIFLLFRVSRRNANHANP